MSLAWQDGRKTIRNVGILQISLLPHFLFHRGWVRYSSESPTVSKAALRTRRPGAVGFAFSDAGAPSSGQGPPQPPATSKVGPALCRRDPSPATPEWGNREHGDTALHRGAHTSRTSPTREESHTKLHCSQKLQGTQHQVVRFHLEIV